MSEDVLDWQELLDRVQEDKDLALELFDIFIEDYKTKRQNLTGALEKQNFDEVRSIAHSLKGASGNISAKALRQSFLKLEEMAKANSLKGKDELLQGIDQKFQELEKRIAEIKAQNKP